MVVISNCVGTKFESMASSKRNGASIVHTWISQVHIVWTWKNKQLPASINRGRVGPKIFGALDETIKLCHFNYFNIFLAFFVAKIKIYNQSSLIIYFQ